MDVLEILEVLQAKALKDEDIRQKLLKTRTEEKPVDAFCRACQELGYPLYSMDLLSAGEDFYASMRRSTNGGGENSPKLAYEDDFYEQFFMNIEKK